MAKLSDFLGGLASSICDARANSDVQSLRIAEEYAKNDLLKHFSVPRMRIDKVELNIPVAIDSLMENSQTNIQPIDKTSFSDKAYQQVLKSLDVSKLTSIASKNLKTTIAEQIIMLEANMKDGKIESSLHDFSTFVAKRAIEIAEYVFRQKKITKDQLVKLQTLLAKELQTVLKDEIVVKKEVKGLESVHVIVEADKLREIKPENVIMIKMTISEQGMEWVNMENKDGNVINRLMPE